MSGPKKNMERKRQVRTRNVHNKRLKNYIIV